MSKHKDKREIQADAVTLEQARLAVVAADTAYVAAISEAQRVADTWPGGATDRRILNDLRAHAARNPDDPSYSEAQRKQIRARITYDEATAAEGHAYGALERAKRTLDELERAATLAARGDGRQALRDAIAAHTEAERQHRINAEAIGRADAAIAESYGSETEAERAVEQAKADAPAHLAALFRGEDVEPAQTVEQAEAALRSILEQRQAVRAAKVGLESEAPRLSSSLRWKADAVTEAIAHVVKSSPATWALVDAFRAAERQHLALKLVVDRLARDGALPADVPINQRPDVDQSALLAWSDAMNALRFDAGAALPEIA